LKLVFGAVKTEVREIEAKRLIRFVKGLARKRKS
jgi:hypothetical protein